MTLLGGLVGGLMTAAPLLWWFAPDVMSPDIPTSPRPLDGVAFMILALFGPMTLVLLIASWNAFARAVTGQAREFLHRGLTKTVGWVVLALGVVTSVSMVSDGEVPDAAGFFLTTATFWLWTRRFARQEPRGSTGPTAVQRRPRWRSRSR